MRINIFTRGDTRSVAIKEQISKRILSHKDLEISPKPDVIIFIGGDGTFLRAVQHYRDALDHLTFIGVHTGTLGFFCDYHVSEIEKLLEDLPIAPTRSHRYRLIKLIRRFDGQSDSFLAVNEVRLENPFHTLVSDVFIDGVMLETFRGNGLIVSSTLGSSGYNKSLGGALIHTSIETMQLTEVATLQNNAFRSLGSSLVLTGAQTITFKGDFTKAVIGYDHLVLEPHDDVNSLEIQLSDQYVHIVHQNNRQYPEILRRSFIKDQ
ncbi:MAG TPA: NAD kinase [Firmicutes bacterium]|nr:NAD kinase [Bacillota bacterium]HAV20261.1 NAD kinase [Bacillota bacterium]